jgi:hypothetical protein
MRRGVFSGQVVDGLTNFQIPLDEDRNYTIVVSRPEDRPKKATLENGVAWLKWSPRGEGLGDPRNRADFGMLILRIMGNRLNWKERPDNITEPDPHSGIGCCRLIAPKSIDADNTDE